MSPAVPPGDPLDDAEVERFSRQLVLPEWSEAAQLRLRAATVLVVGAGALGAPAATYLATAGVGEVRVCDDDEVDASNLHRQWLHHEAGAAKATSAAAFLAARSPYAVRGLEQRFAPGLLDGVDLVVDATDSFASRFAVNDACCAAGVDLVEGGVVGWGGLVLAIRPGASACYRCVVPAAPPPGAVPGCAEAGVLGPAAGVVGSLMALEALKLLTGAAPAALDVLLQLDLLDPGLLRVAVARRPDCVACGDALAASRTGR